MTKAFYKPIITRVGNIEDFIRHRGIPAIVYPCIGIEAVLDRRKHNVIEEHVMNVYKANRDRLKSSYYNIDILWNDGQDVMTDVWSYNKNWNSGDFVDEKTFRGLELEVDKGISADFGLVLL